MLIQKQCMNFIKNNIFIKEGPILMRNGIAVAGNMIVDNIFPIIGYPDIGRLTTISDGFHTATGGIVCNVLTGLAKLDPALSLQAIGAVGKDQNGIFLLEKLEKYANINTSCITKEGKTAFTNVMNDALTNQRTFFVYRGADSFFCEDHIDWNAIHAKILHIGYILLLDALDSPDETYGTKMARLLSHAQERGIRTSIDIVTEIGSRYEKLVPPVLKYTDYCIINELEAQQTTGVLLRDDRNNLLSENIPFALKKLFELGISTWAVVHCPEGGFGLDKSGRFESMDSLSLPSGYIKGTVGAGDAFCSGVLYAAHQDMSLRQGVELGIACAACSLSSASSTGGMRRLDETMALYQTMKG